MYYRLKCECGKEVTVFEGAAGLSLPCACGRKVLVPDLAELRRRAASGELPWSPYGEGERPPLPPNPVAEAGLSVLRWLGLVMGGVVLLLGVGVFVGNVSGRFPTFPLAGYLTMAAGIALMGAAARAIASEKDRVQAEKERAALFEKRDRPEA